MMHLYAVWPLNHDLCDVLVSTAGKTQADAKLVLVTSSSFPRSQKVVHHTSSKKNAPQKEMRDQ